MQLSGSFTIVIKSLRTSRQFIQDRQHITYSYDTENTFNYVQCKISLLIKLKIGILSSFETSRNTLLIKKTGSVLQKYTESDGKKLNSTYIKENIKHK